MYTIRSKCGETFKVNKNVINASTLLKNICELTKVSEPIETKCSSVYLKKFISLINNYNKSTNKKVKDEFNEFEDNIEMLVEMVTDLAILDSDILLDFAADIIIYDISKITFRSWKKLKNYFEFKEEYSESDRKLIEENIFDFFLSIDFEEIKFPFSEAPNFQNLKNKFYTPMNVLLARIIERADSVLSFEFSMINKSLKNENDRFPLKPQQFSGEKEWMLIIRPSTNNSYFRISPDKKNDKYFDRIKSRKIILSDGERAVVYFNDKTTKEDVMKLDSLSFIIPSKDSYLRFHTQSANESYLYLFDMQKCPFTFILFDLSDITFGFDKFFENFIAKDFSKRIEIYASPFFDIFTEEEGDISKNPGATKIREVIISTWDCSKPLLKFKEFILNYMEEDATISANYRLFPQIEELKKCENGSTKFHYSFLQAMEAFKIMEARQKFDSDSQQQYPDDRPLSPYISV